MKQIDERFLSTHPRTALWWLQREQCKGCANLITHGNLAAWQATMRCKAVRMDAGIGAFCIDARGPGAACGPDAKLFSPAVVGEPKKSDEN